MFSAHNQYEMQCIHLIKKKINASLIELRTLLLQFNIILTPHLEGQNSPSLHYGFSLKGKTMYNKLGCCNHHVVKEFIYHLNLNALYA